MPSKLEDVLLRCQQAHGNIRSTLFEYLDDGTSPHNLRQCSRPLRDIISHEPGRLWRNLYVHAPLRPSDNVIALEDIASFCQHLTISIGMDQTATNQKMGRTQRAGNFFKKATSRILPSRKRKSSKDQSSIASSSTTQMSTQHVSDKSNRESVVYPYFAELPESLKNMERWLWQSIIRKFARMSTLTLRTRGHPAWRGRDEPERTLLLLRMCLEKSEIRTLRQIELHPIHGMGILHLRWSSFGAFLEVPNHRGLHFWQNITSLSLRLHNPLAREEQVYGKQYQTFLAILNDYLRSFSRNLLSFKFVWLDREGPNPLALDLEPDMQNHMPLQWPVLKEFWFGNVNHPNRTIALLPDRAPSLTVIKVLRSTHKDANIEFAGEGAWMVISPTRTANMSADRVNLTASSVHSQSEAGTPRAFNRPNYVGSLYDTEDKIEVYDPKDYPAISLTIEGLPPDDKHQVETHDPKPLPPRDSIIEGQPLVDRRLLATSSVYPRDSAARGSTMTFESDVSSVYRVEEAESIQKQEQRPHENEPDAHKTQHQTNEHQTQPFQNDEVDPYTDLSDIEEEGQVEDLYGQYILPNSVFDNKQKARMNRRPVPTSNKRVESTISTTSGTIPIALEESLRPAPLKLGGKGKGKAPMPVTEEENWDAAVEAANAAFKN